MKLLGSYTIPHYMLRSEDWKELYAVKDLCTTGGNSLVVTIVPEYPFNFEAELKKMRKKNYWKNAVEMHWKKARELGRRLVTTFIQDGKYKDRY